jgi:hypothetical protein
LLQQTPLPTTLAGKGKAEEEEEAAVDSIAKRHKASTTPSKKKKPVEKKTGTHKIRGGGVEANQRTATTRKRRQSFKEVKIL